MRIGIDIRLHSKSGVGRYIRNLTFQLAQIDKNNQYVLINPKIKWHSIREQIVLPFILFKKNLDLVHFPYFNVPILYPKKFVVTIHDLTINRFNTGKASTLSPLLYSIKRIGYKIVLLSAIYRAEKIIVPSAAVKKEILKHYDIVSDKIVVIYEGIDRKLKGKSGNLEVVIDNKKLNLVSRQFFLYVGNAYPHKNLNRLINAFCKILTNRPISVKMSKKNLKLILVGRKDYFYRRLIKKVNKLGLDKNVIFAGYVDDRQLVWLYKNAIALVFPSMSEGFGLPALEAMQNECLVLASNIPAIREIGKNVIVYFNPEDIDSITNAMVDSIANYERFGDNINKGKKTASQFSWQKTARKTLKVYESCFSLR